MDRPEQLAGAAALAAFRSMLRIRLVEERIAARYGEQEMRCPVHLSIGQEAVAVGVCEALKGSDQAVGAHRSHAHYLAKGGNLRAMLGELYGKDSGCCRGKGGSMHLIDLAAGFVGAVPIVGSTIPIGVGLAFASSMKGEPRVTAVFFGEGSTEEGVFAESLNFAVLKQLPVVFICENNQFSVYSSLAVRQPPGRQVYELAGSFGLPAFQADGNDVEVVHAAVSRAAERARSGGGPTFLEFMTYRTLEHCGPGNDDHLGYRSLDDVEAWRLRCPVTTYEATLKGRGVLGADASTDLRREIGIEIDQAFAQVRADPWPAPELLQQHLFAPAEGPHYLKS
jgi:pyruvate dehydrogenase E1 component alpha subunit